MTEPGRVQSEGRAYRAHLERRKNDAPLWLGPDDKVFHIKSGVDGQWGYFHEFVVLSPVEEDHDA